MVKTPELAGAANNLSTQLFTIHDLRFTRAFALRPLQRPLAPGVVITNNQDTDKYKHLDQGKLGKAEIVAHKDDGPGQKENRLYIENQKQHRDDVVAHGET